MWANNIKNSKNMFFSPICDPQNFFHHRIFFKKSGSLTFVHVWCPNFMQKIKKTNEPQTDGPYPVSILGVQLLNIDKIQYLLDKDC